MKLNFNQIVNYIQIRSYLNEQCIQNNEDDFFKVKAHFRGKSNIDYLIISFNTEYDAGMALIREADSNSIFSTFKIKDLIDDNAIIVINSPEIKLNIGFQY